MCSTLFYVPAEVAGYPVFGFGLLLVVWAVGSVLLLAWLLARQGFNADTARIFARAVVVGSGHRLSTAGHFQCRWVANSWLWHDVTCGCRVGGAMAVYRARRMGIEPELIMSLAFWLFVSGIVGARLFYLIEYWDKLFAGKSLGQALVAAVSINEGGLVVYGMLVVGGGRSWPLSTGTACPDWHSPI